MFGTKLTFQGSEIFGLSSSKVWERLEWNEGSVRVCSSNSLATRRGTRNLIYILAFILLNFLTTSAYSTSTLLLLHLLPQFKYSSGF